MKVLPRANQTVLDYNNAFYVKQLQILQAVDELVGALFDKIKGPRLWTRTRMFYTPAITVFIWASTA